MSNPRDPRLVMAEQEAAEYEREMQLSEREVAAMEKLAASISAMQKDIEQIKQDTGATWGHSQNIYQSVLRLAAIMERIYGCSVYHGNVQTAILT